MANPLIYPHELTGRSVRLLTIEPDDPSAPLRCKLSETCLDTTPITYNALSYCWGANHSPISITCNLHPLSVTPILHSALHEYRRRRTQAPLWVDAICINQSSISERTSQVRMMDKIYTEAECVVVWLGDAEATDELALNLLKAVQARCANFADTPDLSAKEVAFYWDASLSNVTQEHFNALAAFLLRPWFSRMWIIQEVLLARQVSIWCGPTTANEDFPVLEAIARWSDMTNCVHKTLAAVRAIEDVHVRRSASFKLLCASVLFSIKEARDKAESGTLKLLINTRWFDATDRRDKVFALVGLTSDINQSFVDYSKSYEDLMRDLNLMLLEGRIKPTWGNVLDVLSLITREEDDEIAEPSWVVDVFKPQNFEGSYTPIMGGYPSKEPHIQRKPELRFPKEYGPECLRIRGAVFDMITHMAPFPTFLREGGSQPVGAYDLQNISAYQDWLRRVEVTLNTQQIDVSNADSIYQPTGESLDNAFWRTLCCNRTCVNALKPPTDGSSYRAFLINLILLEMSPVCAKIQHWILGVATASSPAVAYYFRGRNWFLRCALPLAVPLFGLLCNSAWNKAWASFEDHLHIKQRDFQTCHMAWMWGRQFAITEQGLIGLVPIAARVGDSVGFFAGCRVPFALRRRGEGFVLVGDTYLHGVMDGEGEKCETEMLTIV